MNKPNQINHTHRNHTTTVTGGLPVRTNLRAGLGWDDLDDQAAALWGKLTSAVSGAVSSVTDSATSTTATS